VTLTLVTSASLLEVTPVALSFTAKVGTLSLPVQYVGTSLVPPNAQLPGPTASVVSGNWLSVGSATNGSFPVSVNPSGLSIGAYYGSISISLTGAANSPVTVPVALLITAPSSNMVVSPTSLTFAAGIGSPVLTQTLIASALPPASLPGVTSITTANGINWLSVGGSEDLGNGITSFTVSVNPALLTVPGNYAGSIVLSSVETSNSPVTIPVTLTLTVNPTTPIISGVLNAASFEKNTATGNGSPVAPGSLVQIYATLPGATSAGAASVPFPTSLVGVSATFNGFPAPISAVIPMGTYPLINAQVPFEVLVSGASATVNAILTVNGVASPAYPIPIVPAAPGIFTMAENGTGQAILFSLNGVIANPNTPIARGATATLYVTGLGGLLPAISDGMASPVSPAIATPQVFVGGLTAQVLYAGQAPEFPGVDQINIIIPENALTGSGVSLDILTADGSVESNLVTIAVQ